MNNVWELAYEDYKDGMKYREIADKYNVSVNTVKSWKTRKWNEKGVHTKKEKVCTQINRNRGAPKKNKNAEKHGFFSKYLPEETFDIIQGIENKNPLDILWENIKLQYAAIIRAQRIMYVKSMDDKTIEKIEERNGDSSYGEKWEVQQAWDKQANFLNAQSRAMKTLEGMIKQYDELLNKNWDLATEEQKARIAVLKAKTNTDDTGEVEDDGFIQALQGKVEEIWQEE